MPIPEPGQLSSISLPHFLLIHPPLLLLLLLLLLGRVAPGVRACARDAGPRPRGNGIMPQAVESSPYPHLGAALERSGFSMTLSICLLTFGLEYQFVQSQRRLPPRDVTHALDAAVAVMVNGVRVRKLMQVHMRASQIALALYTTRNNDRRAVPLKRGCLTACAAFVCEFSNGLETQSFVIDI